MGKVISIVNQKGGVGKTTLTYNLGSALWQSKAKVLLIDNDPQANLTTYTQTQTLITIDEIYVSRKFEGFEKNQFSTILGEGFSLLGADSMLAGVEYYLASRGDKEFVLKNALSLVKDQFDYIIIDNPPALNMLTVNGLVASDYVVVPVQLEYFSLEGIVALEKTIASLKEKNPHLELLGIVPNMFDDRRKLNWEVLEALKKEFGEKVFETKIHDCVKIAESSGHGKNIFQYHPKGRSSKEFNALAEELGSKCTIKN
ncbi:MAG: ParA family protein [Oligoflexia bacterium]|nr:ParA family protein [Oligoflexia bacterium]